MRVGSRIGLTLCRHEKMTNFLSLSTKYSTCIISSLMIKLMYCGMVRDVLKPPLLNLEVSLEASCIPLL